MNICALVTALHCTNQHAWVSYAAICALSTLASGTRYDVFDGACAHVNNENGWVQCSAMCELCLMDITRHNRTVSVTLAFLNTQNEWLRFTAACTLSIWFAKGVLLPEILWSQLLQDPNPGIRFLAEKNISCDFGRNGCDDTCLHWELSIVKSALEHRLSPEYLDRSSWEDFKFLKIYFAPTLASEVVNPRPPPR